MSRFFICLQAVSTAGVIVAGVIVAFFFVVGFFVIWGFVLRSAGIWGAGGVGDRGGVWSIDSLCYWTILVNNHSLVFKKGGWGGRVVRGRALDMSRLLHSSSVTKTF